jgi:hypothetical protein
VSNAGSGGGASAVSILGIAFIVLKLTHAINWSWWWVLSPFWIPLGLALIIGVFALVIGAFKD